MSKNYLRIESFPNGKPSSIRFVDISHLNSGCSVDTQFLIEAGIIPATGWKQISDTLWNPVRATKSGRTWLRQFYMAESEAAKMLAEYQPKV